MTATARLRLVDGLARRPRALVASGVVLFSTGPVVVAGAAVSGAVLSFWRLWMGVVVMGLATGVQVRRSGRRPDRSGWYQAGACGVAFGLHQLLFMTSLKRTTVVDVTLMQLLAPVIVGILAAIVFGERPGTAFRLWSLVSIAGASVVVLAGSSGPRGDPLGVALAAGNVLFFAVFLVGSRRARAHIDTFPFLFAAMVIAGVLVSAYTLVADAPVVAVGPADLAAAAVLALVPGGLGHIVTTWQLHRVPANVPPILQLGMPFLSGALAWLVLGQAIGLVQVAGGVITLAGVVGALRSPAPMVDLAAPAEPLTP